MNEENEEDEKNINEPLTTEEQFELDIQIMRDNITRFGVVEKAYDDAYASFREMRQGIGALLICPQCKKRGRVSLDYSGSYWSLHCSACDFNSGKTLTARETANRWMKIFDLLNTKKETNNEQH